MTTTNSRLTEQDISFLATLAETAGKRAIEMRSTITVREKTSPHDLVTTADLELSSMIVAALKERFPGDVIISEEDAAHRRQKKELVGTAEDDEIWRQSRQWFIDPIDGTENYVDDDGQYAVMIGLVQNGKTLFGSVFSPFKSATWCGGPEYGLWNKDVGQDLKRVRAPLAELPNGGAGDAIAANGNVRVFMGGRDMRTYTWVPQIPNVTCIKRGSVGLKVLSLLYDDADLYLSLSGQLKLWDTAGPVAIALSAGLEAGTLEDDHLTFPPDVIKHGTAVIIGKTGSVNWAREAVKSPQAKAQ